MISTYDGETHLLFPLQFIETVSLLSGDHFFQASLSRSFVPDLASAKSMLNLYLFVMGAFNNACFSINRPFPHDSLPPTQSRNFEGIAFDFIDPSSGEQCSGSAGIYVINNNLAVAGNNALNENFDDCL